MQRILVSAPAPFLRVGENYVEMKTLAPPPPLAGPWTFIHGRGSRIFSFESPLEIYVLESVFDVRSSVVSGTVGAGGRVLCFP